MRPPQVAAPALLMVVVLFVAACGSGTDNGAGSGTGMNKSGATSSTTSTVLSDSTGTTNSNPAGLAAVLQRAVQEERHAEATYRTVISTLGSIRPFTNIANSEAQHVAALEQLATAHQVDISGIAPTGEASPITKQAACRLGVDAEKADIALYDELLPEVSDHPDVTQVFQNLRAASQDNHLPAFERCA